MARRSLDIDDHDDRIRKIKVFINRVQRLPYDDAAAETLTPSETDFLESLERSLAKDRLPSIKQETWLDNIEEKACLF